MDKHETPTEATRPPGDPIPPRPTEDSPPPTIGPYRLIERLGEGGMGSVWRAEQSEPVRRTVAVKLIKAGMDSREVIARFEAERQALALMDHPSIAKVFDAGTTAQGRPFFVMELVAGVPINEYCDRQRLGTRERLELFLRVCEAVQHAHQKAVLHRDLKPGNVLVGEVDGKPSPKIIDFGVAKATAQPLTEETMATALGAILGTPAYMSPEQADFTGDNVDTRTDVYSLGVILYELLAGALPFDPNELRNAGFDGIRKMLREQEPPKPSSRLSTLGDRATVIAQVRGTTPGRLRNDLAGDLDWIVMRALEKDRNRRYASPNEFAQDIRRHLTHEPVVAGPPSVRYRAGKFVRRHRTGVWVGSTALLALVGFAVVTTFQARSIARERDRAADEAAKAGAMNVFLSDMLGSANPWGGGEHDVTVVQALDAAVEEIGEAFPDQPLVEAEMRDVIAQTYLALGKLEPAEEQARRALEMRIEHLGPDHLAVAKSWLSMVTLGRHKKDHEPALEAAAELARIRLLRHADPHPDVVEALHEQARILLGARRFAEADSVLRLSEQMIHQLGDPPAAAAQQAFYRASEAFNQGNPATGELLFRDGLRLFREHDPEDPNIPVGLNNIATMLLVQEKYDSAKAMFEEALGIYEQKFGTEHPEYAVTIENLGNVAFRQKRYDDALAALERVREIRARNLGEDHIDVMRTMLNTATVASRADQNQRAIEIFDELLPRLRAARGKHPDTATALHSKGVALRNLGRYSESIATLREAEAMFIDLYGEEHAEVASTRSALGSSLLADGRLQEAEAMLTVAFPVLRDTFGKESRGTIAAARALVDIYVAQGKPAKADEYRAYVDAP